ncbi:MAG: 2-C-methyl-D-erythritol 4-phosphate cytidylyltransferase [Bacillota bacterium]
MCRVSAIVAAAGRGQRMGVGLSKQYLSLAKRPVLAHTLDLFERCTSVDEIIIVVSPDDLEYCRQNVVVPGKYKKIRQLIAGGEERQHSVYNGLVQVSQRCSLVVVHDGARPLLTLDILESVIDTAGREGAAIAAVPVKDTIKVGNAEGIVCATPERRNLWSVQTPQAFKKEILLEAYELARREKLIATDDASLVENLGYPVRLVEASYENLKITTPDDMWVAEAILKRRNDDAGRAGI